MTDDAIRESLRPLRQASVPPVPSLAPAPPSARGAPVAMLAAAAMLAILAGVLFFPRAGERTPAAALLSRLEALEERVRRIEDAEIRALMTREVELLRRELALAEHE